MDFEEIKNLIEIEGGRLIIVDEGKPRYVIVAFEEFRKLIASKEGQSIPQEGQTTEVHVATAPLPAKESMTENVAQQESKDVQESQESIEDILRELYMKEKENAENTLDNLPI